jgi:hypothetical protein
MKKLTVTAATLMAGALMIPAIASASSCCPGPARETKDTAAVVSDKKSADAKVVAQTKCPVMGGKINKKQFADVNGKRIYVCCPGCIKKIKADPAKYVKQLEGSGVTLAKTPSGKVAKKDQGKDKHAGHHN